MIINYFIDLHNLLLINWLILYEYLFNFNIYSMFNIELR